MNSVTGIPVDLLITGFASICAFIGLAMWKELARLGRESARRGTQLALLRQMMRQVCDKLGIHYTGENGEE